MAMEFGVGDIVGGLDHSLRNGVPGTREQQERSHPRPLSALAFFAISSWVVYRYAPSYKAWLPQPDPSYVLAASMLVASTTSLPGQPKILVHHEFPHRRVGGGENSKHDDGD